MSYNHLRVSQGSGGRFESIARQQIKFAQEVELNPDHEFWKSKMLESSDKLTTRIGKEEMQRRVWEKFPTDDFTFRQAYEWYRQQLKEAEL